MEIHDFKMSGNRRGLTLLVVVTFALSIVIVLSNPIGSAYIAYSQVQNITKKGTFNYTQSDALANPDWINTGKWSLKESPSVVFTFNAIINMAKPNGSEAHQHLINDLMIPYAPFDQANSTIIKGTTTITMDNGFFVSNEPTTITLSEKNISVYFDPTKIENHFGNQSITGVVT